VLLARCLYVKKEEAAGGITRTINAMGFVAYLYPRGAVGSGGWGKKKVTQGQVAVFFGFWRLHTNFRDFFNRVLKLPLSRNAQKRD
jgi:hypothetical protein